MDTKTKYLVFIPMLFVAIANLAGAFTNYSQTNMLKTHSEQINLLQDEIRVLHFALDAQTKLNVEFQQQLLTLTPPREETP